MRPVPVDAVTMNDGFWRDRMEINRTVAIPRLYDRLAAHGVVDNFRPGHTPGGLFFTDSDLYKWMEAAAWSLASTPDGALEEMLEGVVALVVGAQHADGYVNTHFDATTRFGDLRWSHELYCAGHLFQAAVAHHAATGRTTLLDAAVRFADLLATTFGADGRPDRDRHPVVEMGLIDLARVTGDGRYRDFASVLCDRVDTTDWDRLWGHVVCALYYASACTDLALDGQEHRRAPLDRWWRDLVERSSYVTGAVGGRWLAESMGRPYELPHEGAYAESCCAVATMQWAQRMLQLTGDVAVADHLELVLHNALAASVSIAGDEWFYANPQASSHVHEQSPFLAGVDLPLQIAGPLPLVRLPWRDVTCCPPNVTRLLASLPSYLYLASADELRVVLYASSRVRTGEFDVEIATGMPWDGRIAVRVHRAPARDASITMRIPQWSTAPDAGRWRELRRTWRPGETFEVDLGLATDLLVANPRVAEASGRVAVRRGPLVYCAEACDNPGVDLRDVVVASDAVFDAVWDATLLGGTTVLAGDASVARWTGPLYRNAGAARVERAPARVTLVPYARWANREMGPMTVWLQDGDAGIGRHSN